MRSDSTRVIVFPQVFNVISLHQEASERSVCFSWRYDKKTSINLNPSDCSFCGGLRCIIDFHGDHIAMLRKTPTNPLKGRYFEEGDIFKKRFPASTQHDNNVFPLEDNTRRLMFNALPIVYFVVLYIVSLIITTIGLLCCIKLLQMHRKVFWRALSFKRTLPGVDSTKPVKKLEPFSLSHFLMFTCTITAILLLVLCLDMYGLNGLYSEDTRVHLYMAAFAMIWFPLHVGFYFGLGTAVEFLPYVCSSCQLPNDSVKNEFDVPHWIAVKKREYFCWEVQ